MERCENVVASGVGCENSDRRNPLSGGGKKLIPHVLIFIENTVYYSYNILCSCLIIISFNSSKFEIGFTPWLVNPISHASYLKPRALCCVSMASFKVNSS